MNGRNRFLRNHMMNITWLIRRILCDILSDILNASFFKRLRDRFGIDFLRFLFFFSDRNFRNQLLSVNCIGQNRYNLLINLLLMIKAYFHLLRMHIHIQCAVRECKIQHGKRILMLHHIIFVRLLNRFCNDFALDITAVDIIILIIAIASGNSRHADISCDFKKFTGSAYFDQICGNFATIYMINHITQITVSGSMQFGLILLNIFK